VTLVQRAISKPSTTISWAFLAGVGAAMCWEAVDTFTAFEPTAGLISGSTTLVAGIVGKMVTEKVLK
jgi:hypothetical protein